jgi:aryl carrier-like protein
MSDEKTLELPDGMAVEDAADVLGEYHKKDDAQIVSADTLNSLEDKVDELADVFRAALDEQTALSRDTIDSMPVDALCNEFRDEDGDISPDTLNQSPETTTGGNSGSDNSGDNGSNDDWRETLSRSEVGDVKLKIRKADSFEGRGMEERADTLRSEAAEIAGTDAEDMADVKLDSL